MKYRRKKDDDMTAASANNLSLSDFIKQNKNRLYEAARKNTKLNKDGNPIISRDDDWFYEDEWDKHFERTQK